VGKLGNLILNENMKLYRRPRTWIMVGLLIGIVILGSLIDWYYDDKNAKPDAWRDQVTQERLQNAEALKEPGIDNGYRTYLQDSNAIIDYQLEHDIRSTSGTMWDGILGSASLVILITLFTVVIAGDSLAGEFSTGTIKLLLIRPANRLKILLAKYVSMIMFGLLLLVILFIVSILVNGLLYKFGFVDLSFVDVNAQGQAVEMNMVANLWKTYLLNGVSTIMFVTMAFMISSAFRSSTMAIGFSIFALFAGALVMELLQPYEWSKYMLFANIELSQHLSGRPYQEGMTLSFSVIVLAVHYIIFNLTSWLVFTRRDVAS
jgi:ABC-2 type transport system permease protein